MTDLNHFGPIEYIVVEFPDGALTPEGFEQLLVLVDSGTIRILDLEFVVKLPSGHAVIVDAGGLSTENFDATVFGGASSHLLDVDDLALIAEDIGEGSLAAVLVYEELTLLPAIEAWTTRGATIITEGHLDLDGLATILTNTADTAQEIQE
ncbi:MULTISPECIES: DUF6325 family protein [Rhodococcus]|uniref:DUF1269 domain-containing family protein n=1 Tax=Rhodococcus erythropolis TaxID=1833 RepID=A0A8I1DA03_RHOER|nr:MULTISPECIES: DUF6325 family protein [Rhodococcus]MBH5146369.1 hypothetical protein [Rhodococcus erythropolis]QXC46854.1 hypothetical protein KSE96_32870 [Rhodococcus qingshengii]